MHLYDDTLEKYVARELPPQTLSGLDAHVSNCLFCAHALAEDRVIATRWVRRGWLGRLVRLDEPAGTAVHFAEARAEAA